MAREDRSKWMKILAGIAVGLLITASVVSTVLIPFLYAPSALVNTWYGLSAITSLAVEFLVLAVYAYKNKTSNNTTHVILANPSPAAASDSDNKLRTRSADVTNDLDNKETNSSAVSSSSSSSSTASESSITSSTNSSSYSSIGSSVSSVVTSTSSTSPTTPSFLPLSFTTSEATSTSSPSLRSDVKKEEPDKKIFIPDLEPQPRDPEIIITELLDKKDSSNNETLWQELLRSDDKAIGNYIIQQGPYQGASILWLAFKNEKWEVALELLNRAPNKSVDPNAHNRGFKWQTSMYILMYAIIMGLRNKRDTLVVHLEQIYDLLIEKSSKRIDLNRVENFRCCFSFAAIYFARTGKDTRFQRLEKLLTHSELIDLNSPIYFVDKNRPWTTTVFHDLLDTLVQDLPNAPRTLKLLLEHANSAIDFNLKTFFWLDTPEDGRNSYRDFFIRLFDPALGQGTYAMIQVIVREHKHPLIFPKEWTEENPLVMVQLLSYAQNKEDHFTLLKLMDAGMYPPVEKIRDWKKRSGSEPERIKQEMIAAGGTAAFCTVAVLPNLLKAAESVQKLYEDLKLEMTFIGWVEFISAKKGSQIPTAIRLMFHPYLIKVEPEYLQKLLTIVERFSLQRLEQLRKDGIQTMVTTAVYIYTKNYENVRGLPSPQWNALSRIFRLALDDTRVISDSLLQNHAFRRQFYQKVKESAQSGEDLYVRNIENLVQQTKISLGMLVPESKSKSETPTSVQKPSTCPLEWESYYHY